jgi:diguanylate cyclase (GGDEF)-like protein
MEDLASRSNGDARSEQSLASEGINRNSRIRGAYLAVSLVLIALCPFLAAAGRETVYLLVSLGAIPAVFVGLRRVSPSHRQPWALLLAGLVVLNIADDTAVLSSGPAVTDVNLLDAAAYVLVLAAAIALVLQQRPKNLGRIIDALIAALALGGVLWDVMLSPNLATEHQQGPAKLAACVVILALSGVVGTLAQLDTKRASATSVRPLIAGVTLALVSNMIVAVTTDPWLVTAAGMMSMGAYTGVALFGLDPRASELVTPAPVRPDRLSPRRLVFLGIAVAIVPLLVGARQLLGESRDGLVLVISSVTIATLVMVRIGQLSGQRDEAERALRHEATHDSLTGLLNRTELIAKAGEQLPRDHRAAIIYLDLNGFKEVNDRFGHANGDRLLVEVAQRLRDCVRADDEVSRFGGDEFVILLRHAKPDEVETIKRRIVEALSRPVPVSGELVTIGASTGSALATGEETDPEELIIRADQAMYAAKTNGTAERG